VAHGSTGKRFALEVLAFAEHLAHSPRVPKRPTDRQLRNALAARLKQARAAKGWTLEQVAEALELAPETVWKYEAGKIALSVVMLRRLARVLSVEPAWLLGVDPPTLRKGEDEVLQMWRRLSEDERQALKTLLKRLLKI